MQGNIKLCFVCTGNTCRSFMAERIMKKMIKKEGLTFVKVSSRGLNALGDDSAPNAMLALKKLGYSSVKRKSQKLNRIDQKTLYIAPTTAIKNKIAGRVIEMKDLIGHEIADPYGQGQEEYLEVAKDIEKACQTLIDKLKKIGGQL